MPNIIIFLHILLQIMYMATLYLVVYTLYFSDSGYSKGFRLVALIMALLLLIINIVSDLQQIYALGASTCSLIK